MEEKDVLIIGAGPTGLTMAAELARYGVDFSIIDKKKGTTKLSKAIGIQARSLELFEDLGITGQMVKKGHIADSVRLVTDAVPRAKLPLGRMGKGMSKYPFMLILEQSMTEKIIIKKIKQLKSDVQWESELVDIKKKQGHYLAKVKNKRGIKTIKCKYLIACDGARSYVRKTFNFDFGGITREKKFYVIDAEIKWNLKLQESLFLLFNKKSFLALFRMGKGNKFRVIGDLQDHPASIANEDVPLKEILDDAKKDSALKKFEFKKLNWHAVYKIHTRMADRFSKDNIFLAGDAAHIHSPAGGQGMNTGMQDAYNLAWKLAFVIKGKAPSRILETYRTEREAFAKLLLKSTDKAFNILTAENFLVSIFRTKILPLIIQFLSRFRSFRKKVFKTVSQTQIRYSSDLVVESKQGSVFAGERMPYFKHKNKNIHDYLRKPKFHLLVVGSNKDFPETLPEFVEVLNFKSLPSRLFGSQKRYFVLVRPDKYISYIGNNFAEIKNFMQKIST